MTRAFVVQLELEETEDLRAIEAELTATIEPIFGPCKVSVWDSTSSSPSITSPPTFPIL